MNMKKFASALKKTLVPGVCSVIEFEKIEIVDVTDLKKIKTVFEAKGLEYLELAKALKTLREKTEERVNFQGQFYNSDCKATVESKTVRDEFTITISNTKTSGKIEIVDFFLWMQFCHYLIQSIISSFYSPNLTV